MVTIKNALWSPLTVELLNGKVILLAPRGLETITEEEFQSEGFQKAFRAGMVNVLPPTAAPVKTTPVVTGKPAKEGTKNA